MGADKTIGRSNDWDEDIYAAPGEVRAAAQTDEDARVTMATGLRRPRVYLTAPFTVQELDLRRYMGRWYEIARLPYFTQRRCVGDVYAEYRLGDDGMIYVTNRCLHQDGGIGEAKGLARVADARSNARLQISFRMLYGVHVFWDDYWVIGLGDDYDYALVGQPTRRRGWVLAREPNPSDSQVKQWLQEFADKGFPAASFVRTVQGMGSIPELPPAA
jgi:apolipoprotein D and lipocalin family protein